MDRGLDVMGYGWSGLWKCSLWLPWTVDLAMPLTNEHDHFEFLKAHCYIYVMLVDCCLKFNS